MIKVHLYRKPIKRDIEEVKRQLCKSLDIDHKSIHRPHGFEAVASFNLGYIYIDDYLNSRLTEKLKKEIDDCLTRFLEEDYGRITGDEADENGANRWLFGEDIFGKYEVSVGLIEILKSGDRSEIRVLPNNGKTKSDLSR